MLNETLNLINEFLNMSDMNNFNYYINALKMMASLFDDALLAIYFCENTDYNLKAALKDGKIIKEQLKIDERYINHLLNSEDDLLYIKTAQESLLKKNTILVKLQIKSSIYGFALLSVDYPIDEELELSFHSVVNILSYKIKDYELSEIFKLQLKTLQSAIIEKAEACDVVSEQHKKLQELDKAKNLFLANISHELRTPLNAIIGFAQALDAQIFGSLNSKQAEYIKDIQISSLHLLGMINEILDLSKIEANAIKFNPIELNPKSIIEEVINILEPLYSNKNIKINFHSNFDGMINADYQKFQQILFNLLSNAIKFTNNGGKIDINSYADNKNYILKIKDNGVGIAKKYHNKIFKKFVHLDNADVKNQTSTGLGLTITKELVKLHKGKITLQSEAGKGSEFTMEFKKIIV